MKKSLALQRVLKEGMSIDHLAKKFESKSGIGGGGEEEIEEEGDFESFIEEEEVAGVIRFGGRKYG
jgi:hypothetical protein